jgi:hypothetical protein
MWTAASMPSHNERVPRFRQGPFFLVVIAKLDYLSRNLAFIATLMDSNAEFIAADNPHANRLTVHILAAVAEHKRGAISERTKAAAKRRGVKLGSPRLAAARKASIALLSPEIPKPIRGQLGVTHRVLNILVPQPTLQCASVVASVG